MGSWWGSSSLLTLNGGIDLELQVAAKGYVWKSLDAHMGAMVWGTEKKVGRQKYGVTLSSSGVGPQREVHLNVSGVKNEERVSYSFDLSSFRGVQMFEEAALLLDALGAAKKSTSKDESEDVPEDDPEDNGDGSDGDGDGEGSGGDEEGDGNPEA